MLRPDGIVKVLDFGLAKVALTNLNADVDAEAATMEFVKTDPGALDGFGALAASRGESELATSLAGAAEQLRESINYNIEPAERRFREAYLASTRVVLSEAVFSAAYAKGRRLKLDEAVALAMGKVTS